MKIIISKSQYNKLFLNEDMSEQNISNILIKRIPFIKEYNVYTKNEKELGAQRIVYNEDVIFFMKDEILNFPIFNVVSEIKYYKHEINDKTFNYFNILNSFPISKPKDMDDLTFTVFIHAKKQLEKNMSYRKEIMTNNNEPLPKETLDQIINDMNGNLFKLEQFTEDHYINLF